MKRKIKAIVILITVIPLTVAPFVSLRAQDFPSGYIGGGYREYLSGIISTGYQIEEFTRIDMRLKEGIDKRNKVEALVNSSLGATGIANNGIFAAQAEIVQNYESAARAATVQKQESEKVASAQGAFNYLPNSDGKILYFKDGLIDHIDNERILDEFGNVSLRNSYNYEYNDNRLLTGFESDTKDVLGNIDHFRQYGMLYTADSLFYGDIDTNANKNLVEYFVEETDSAGNKKNTRISGGVFEGKYLRAFSQTVADSVYGNSSFTRTNIIYENNNPRRSVSYHEQGVGTDNLSYSSDRSNITYNNQDQTAGYHDEMIVAHLDGNKTKTITDAKFTYIGAASQFGKDVDPEQERLAESVLATTTINSDGSIKTETAVVTYGYAGDKLISAAGHSEYNGQEADWWEYVDQSGNILTHAVENDVEVYFYLDSDTNEKIYVAVEQIDASLKAGDTFVGSSDIQYEILYGVPMSSVSTANVTYYTAVEHQLIRSEQSVQTFTNGLVNNLRRALSMKDVVDTVSAQKDISGNPETGHKEIDTAYIYDAKTGNLVDAQGQGTNATYRLTDNGWEYSLSDVTVDYDVIWGKALQAEYTETERQNK